MKQLCLGSSVVTVRVRMRLAKMLTMTGLENYITTDCPLQNELPQLFNLQLEYYCHHLAAIKE